MARAPVLYDRTTWSAAGESAVRATGRSSSLRSSTLPEHAHHWFLEIMTAAKPAIAGAPADLMRLGEVVREVASASRLEEWFSIRERYAQGAPYDLQLRRAADGFHLRARIS